MSILTPIFKLFKLVKGDPYTFDQFNDNMDIIDREMAKPPLTVNDAKPDDKRNIQIDTVPLADNLTSDEAQLNTGTFIIRTSGGEASIANGSAWLTDIRGNMSKSGYVAEELSMAVDSLSITAVLNRDEFVAAAATSGTYEFIYIDSWDVDPATYGITITGTPDRGDNITVTYVKENRGTITTAMPTSFISTGWNLYNHTAGYARVTKYSEEYGFMISGTYTALEFAETISGTRETITPVNGYFTVPADGYVFVTGGNGTDTAIWMTWSDWTDEPNGGTFEAYSQTVIDLSGLMVSFPDGLMRIETDLGPVYDEINLNTQRAYSRIERMEYTDENLENVIASGMPYDTDQNYIYAVRAEPVTMVISLSGDYTVSDHGIEMFNGTLIPVTASALYGQDLKGKLRRDVLTLSAQTLTWAQRTQVRNNLGLGTSVLQNMESATFATDAADPAIGYYQDVVTWYWANDMYVNFVMMKNLTSDCQPNYSYVTGDSLKILAFGKLVIVQIMDLKFDQDIPSGSSSNEIKLYQAKYYPNDRNPLKNAVSQLFLLHRFGDASAAPLRLRFVGGNITPWYSAIPATPSGGEGWFGICVTYLP